MDNVDFIVICGRWKASINAETIAAKRWLRAGFAVDENSSACLVIDNDHIEEIITQFEKEGFIVQVR